MDDGAIDEKNDETVNDTVNDTISETIDQAHASFLKKWAGLILIILSFGFYGSILLLPFLSISGENKIMASAALVVLGEASFWFAVLILGKEAISKYRKFDWRNKIAEWFKI